MDNYILPPSEEDRRAIKRMGDSFDWSKWTTPVMEDLLRGYFGNPYDESGDWSHFAEMLEREWRA